MPEISSAALKLLSNYPTADKHSAKKKPIFETCKTCNKPYNKTLTNKALADIASIADINYENTCLNCIKEEIQNIKKAKYPNLKELRKKQNIINKVYQKSYNQWKEASNEYQALDYQEKMLLHQLTKLAKVPKASTPKKAKSKDQIKKATAMKILASLTEAQRTTILANMAK